MTTGRNEEQRTLAQVGENAIAMSCFKCGRETHWPAIEISPRGEFIMCPSCYLDPSMNP